MYDIKIRRPVRNVVYAERDDIVVFISMALFTTKRTIYRVQNEREICIIRPR